MQVHMNDPKMNDWGECMHMNHEIDRNKIGKANIGV